MESNQAKESIVSRLFGFGKKRDEDEALESTSASESKPTNSAAPDDSGGFAGDSRGFAATDAAYAREGDDEEDEPQITVPEQVIRIRTGSRKKDEVINAIGDSFQELNKLLGSVSDRLDRQDDRATDLSDQLREIPDYLRQLPELHAEQNQIARQTAEIAQQTASSLAMIPEVQREFAASARVQAEEQRVAMKSLSEAQQQTARVIHHGNQKQLQLFHQATQKTLLTVHQTAKAQRSEMEKVLSLTEQNMKRMLILTGAFVLASLLSVVAMLWLR